MYKEVHDRLVFLIENFNEHAWRETYKGTEVQEYQKMDAQKKETATSERGGAVADNPSSDSLFSDGKERLSRYPLTHQKYDAKLRQNTEATKNNIKKLLNKGDFVIKGDDANSIVRALGKALRFEKSASSESYYREIEESYEVELENEGRTASIRISNHPASGDRFGNKQTDDKVSIVVYKNGEHHTKKEHDEYEEWIFDPSKLSKEEIGKSILNGIKSLIDNGEFTDETTKAQKIKYLSTRTDEIIAKSKANGTYMKAPNGKPSRLSEKQWAQTRTPAFKEWFGDWENDPKNASMAVDENGEPLVVYHSSDTDFEKFEQQSKGWSKTGVFWFSVNDKYSKKYGDKTKAFFLNIRNYRDIGDIEISMTPDNMDALSWNLGVNSLYDEKRGYDPSDEYYIIKTELEEEYAAMEDEESWEEIPSSDEIEKEAEESVSYISTYTNSESFRELLIENGIDGVMAMEGNPISIKIGGKEIKNKQYRSFGIVDAKNIKSATDNNGEFNGNDDRFYYRTADASVKGQKKESSALVNNAALEAVNALGGGFVHTNRKNLPTRARVELAKNPDAMGYYDPKTGEVHIFAFNCPTRYEAEKTVMHEKVAHEGLRGLLGKEGYDGYLAFRVHTGLALVRQRHF